MCDKLENDQGIDLENDYSPFLDQQGHSQYSYDYTVSRLTARPMKHSLQNLLFNHIPISIQITTLASKQLNFEVLF